MSSEGRKPRVVLDTNQVVSSQIARTSPPARVIDGWLRGEFSMVASAELLEELADVLSRPVISGRYGLRQAEIEELIQTMRLGMTVAVPESTLPVHCRDPKDDKVLAAALGAGADYIVTGDEDLLALDGHPALGRLRIVSPQVFLNVLGSGSDRI